MRRALPWLILVALTGCEDSVRFPTVPSAQALTGTWAYRANLSGSGFECRIEGTTLQFTAAAGVIGGTAQNVVIFCSRGVVAFSGNIFEEAQPPIEGTFSGNDLSFTIATPDYNHKGIFSSNQMIGDVNLTFDVALGDPPIGVLSLSGQFEGAKLVVVTGESAVPDESPPARGHRYPEAGHPPPSWRDTTSSVWGAAFPALPARRRL